MGYENLLQNHSVILVFVPKFGSQDDVLSQNFLFFYNPQSYGLELLKSMDVSKNNGTPKSSILIGFSIINHPFWGI